jgi:hypothetical protein
MDFVLVALCGFSSVYTEILIGESEFPGNRTCPAGAHHISGNTEQTFSSYTIQQLIMFPGTAVVGRTCRADTDLPLFVNNLLALFCISLP